MIFIKLLIVKDKPIWKKIKGKAA